MEIRLFASFIGNILRSISYRSENFILESLIVPHDLMFGCCYRLLFNVRLPVKVKSKILFRTGSDIETGL